MHVEVALLQVGLNSLATGRAAVEVLLFDKVAKLLDVAGEVFFMRIVFTASGRWSRSGGRSVSQVLHAFPKLIVEQQE